ncbi:MAG TPA: bifunctional aldolase/short-chain dehydrogenase [Polyangiaceae bacterium]|nr:bifunctional aldolase/short-chain dehydrogenase [Polyangiaceae bacterium]
MKSRWNDDEAKAALARYEARYGDALALRAYTSRLLGADPTLVVHGGGNTSVKGTAREISGEETPALFVKGSGWDLATIHPDGFSVCRLEPLLRCLALPALSDPDMVRALRSQMLDPNGPTPSVEALLHAFIPAKFVDHAHANAVLAVVDQPDGQERAREIWGESAVVVPYVMPGFLLAKAVHAFGAGAFGGGVMVLDRHGIFTWGETAKESYERMIAAVSAAEAHIGRARSRVSTRPMRARTAVENPRARRRPVTPLVRGALARASGGSRFVLEWRDEPEILALLDRPDARALSSVGPMTPDHVLRTKPTPAWLGELPTDPDAARVVIEAELRRFGEAYAAYFEENRTRYPESLTRLDLLPRVLLAPGMGALTVGKTLAEARIVGDVYAQTAGTILDAETVGRYRPVEPADLFDVEYWSLEQAKLGRAASGGSLDRKIALVTGAARGIGRATAAHFLAEGAHVLLSDVDGRALQETAFELEKRFGLRVASVAADVTADGDAARIVSAAVDTFGGLDVVVSNAGNAPSGLLHTGEGEAALERSLLLNLLGHQRVARAACDTFLAQGIGGVLLFNASKSAWNPGKEFGPYAVPKAAVLALMKQYAVDLGAHGIRANAVNADRIRTALFDGILEERARARGVSPDEYFRDNLLHRETTAEDVAKAFSYLATAEATTGSVLTVDGGNAAAFPR